MKILLYSLTKFTNSYLKLLVCAILISSTSCQSQSLRKNETELSNSKDQNKSNMKLNKLTEEEQYVILNKGTDRPFTGEYTDQFDKGTYVCRQCNAPLYKSDSKFHSNCGWPSFDDEIKGAIIKTVDADGDRTEITCANCGGHLGHVFYGERMTDKNTRHCVNSTSMLFKPEIDAKPTGNKAIFAGGCFWGVEYYFQNAKGVINTTVGYTGGSKEKPTYEEVCRHLTGHYEALEIEYDPSKTTYEELAKLFFEIHDPTQADGQGNDIGQQYHSVVFYLDDEQKATTEKLIKILNGKGYQVATKLIKATTFWPAEEYHQKYYEKEGGTPYCHKRVKRF